MSPGMSDKTTTIIVVDVDLDDPRNDNPIQHLDDGESVVVRKVPLTVGLRDFLKRETEKKGGRSCLPLAMLYSFALGLEMGAKLSHDETNDVGNGSSGAVSHLNGDGSGVVGTGAGGGKNGTGVVIQPNRQSIKLQQQYQRYQTEGRIKSDDEKEESCEC